MRFEKCLSGIFIFPQPKRRSTMRFLSFAAFFLILSSGCFRVEDLSVYNGDHFAQEGQGRGHACEDCELYGDCETCEVCHACEDCELYGDCETCEGCDFHEYCDLHEDCDYHSADEAASNDIHEEHGGHGGYGGHGNENAMFKLPLPPGYNWEVTQSWSEHCELCNAKGYNTIHGGFFGDFCTQMSHAALCPNTCKYGWDFNLPGEADHGKPVLATANGSVKDVGYNSWGNYVILDHGNNVCSRYAHLRNNSTRVLIGQQVCQGLKIAEIGNTGNSAGSHLHFQFERCDTREPLRMGFDDGNGIPVCTMGSDIFDENGKYNFLILSNVQVDDCIDGPIDFGGGEFTGRGWREAGCGSISGCPMIPNCNRSYGHIFVDHSILPPSVAQAAMYLHSECVLDGKADGRLHHNHEITRAEALKVAIHLFGLLGNCDYSQRFDDVLPGDWYYDVVSCAATHGIIMTDRDYFYPNRPVSMGEAAKILTVSAAKVGLISIMGGSVGLTNVDISHWAYNYLVTMYYYGGLYGDMLSWTAESTLNRGEYFVMAAALSPCYCGNIACESGCSCDQATLSCKDPYDNTSGSGGGGIIITFPDDDPEDCDDEGGGDDSGSDDSGGTSGGSDSTGDSGGTSGGSGDSGGTDDWDDNDGGFGGFDCDPSGWSNNSTSGIHCDHCTYAMVRLEFSSDGVIELLSVGESSAKRTCFFAGDILLLYYRRNELPSVIKLSGDPGTVQVYRLGSDTPPFDIWLNYNGAISLNPSTPPSMTGVGTPFLPFEVGVNSMLRLPLN